MDATSNPNPDPDPIPIPDPDPIPIPNPNPNPNPDRNRNRNPIPSPNPNPNPEQVWKPLLLLAVDRLYSTSTGLGEYAEDPREQCRYLFEALNALPVSALPPVREPPEPYPDPNPNPSPAS